MNWERQGVETGPNWKSWRREPYLGFGAGAHSFSGTQRWANRHDAAAYVAAISQGRNAIESVDTLTPTLALEEEFFLGLRQLSGIELARIEREYGVSVADKIGELAARGMVEND